MKEKVRISKNFFFAASFFGFPMKFPDIEDWKSKSQFGREKKDDKRKLIFRLALAFL